MPLVADLVFAFGPICLLDDPSTPRLWVWVRKVLERLVAPRVTVHWLEPEQKERRLYAALRAVEQLWYALQDFEAARKGGEQR